MRNFISVVFLFMFIPSIAISKNDFKKLNILRDDRVSRYELIGMMMYHHDGKYFQWRECGKQLNREEGKVRSEEYADAILDSVNNLKERTNVYIDPRFVRAIMYKESSDDECAVGMQEVNRFSKSLGHKPKKSDIVSYVERWRRFYREAVRWCSLNRENSLGCEQVCLGDTDINGCLKACKKYRGRSGCVYSRMNEKHPEYKGIYAWDMGVSQFRYPALVEGRAVSMPDGSSFIVGIPELLNYKISIQLLVENMVEYRKECSGHRHFLLSKNGSIVRRLLPEEAYFAHHHTGTHVWSQTYWLRIARSIVAADSWKMKTVAFMKGFFFSIVA